ncbi:adenosylcobinamide-phosphate synthase [Motilibacter peucedani]|uniref:Cobalamin biosynthesis protein CobD n=1 Tax=Motilibacter peucedani TaxID=598650 RepID=A0A420XNL1_9ACTN|nr:cobalamin biosynthesis protein [Motilibacter peucedani]RKS73774.1 adenosylcobinamide-phosphate synthase [Motilibacter peucedani]
MPTAAGLLLGSALDAALGDPRRGHPVAGFGAVAARLEALVWSPSRGRGTAYAVVLTGSAATLGVALARATRSRPLARTAVTALVTWSVLGGTSLRREGTTLGDRLLEDDLDAARAQLPALCGRDASVLDGGELARAGLESVAENTSDAAVAPLLWGGLLGLPGLLAYRAANTLDAMVGHRSERYEAFGWASARLDDVLNLLPSRVTGVLAVVLAPMVGGRSRDALRVFLADRAAHPSPNSGQCEAAFAGALSVRLGGTNVYAGRVEHRPVLGSASPACGPRDLARAARLSGAVQIGAVALGVLLALLRPASSRRGAA